MRTITMIFAASILSTLAACATPPDRIKPIASNGQPCTPADMTRLNQLSEEQGKMARNDVMGVLIIGFPVGSIGKKDHKTEIATLKGRCSW